MTKVASGVEPLTITITRPAKVNPGYERIIAEVICERVPASIKKRFPRMAGGDYWYLHRLWVSKPFRRLGLAKRLLSDICTITNARGISLVLRVNPFEAGGMSAERLIKFYRGYRFSKLRGTNLMERM